MEKEFEAYCCHCGEGTNSAFYLETPSGHLSFCNISCWETYKAELGL